MQSKLEQQLRVQETVPGQQHKPKQKVSASEQIPKTKARKAQSFQARVNRFNPESTEVPTVNSFEGIEV